MPEHSGQHSVSQIIDCRSSDPRQRNFGFSILKAGCLSWLIRSKSRHIEALKINFFVRKWAYETKCIDRTRLSCLRHDHGLLNIGRNYRYILLIHSSAHRHDLVLIELRFLEKHVLLHRLHLVEAEIRLQDIGLHFLLYNRSFCFCFLSSILVSRVNLELRENIYLWAHHLSSISCFLVPRKPKSWSSPLNSIYVKVIQKASYSSL